LAGKKKRPFAVLRRRLLRWLAAVLSLLVLTSVLQVVLLRWVPPLFTVPMACSWVSRPFGDGPHWPIRYRWIPLTGVSFHLQRAVLAAEDQRFFDHHGFDLVEIRHALTEAAGGDRLRGASTISMQTARSVFLVPSRSIWRKGLEAYYTVLIEALWSKRRILEMYLNTVDWGDGIFGAEAAARAYFKASAADLNRPRAALLAAILPNPHRFSPLRPTSFVRQRQQRILADMPRMPLVP
jgi:monofunctional biosynthetic peptidoglycan transglycosylase